MNSRAASGGSGSFLRFRLGRNRDGATAIEFAIIAPVLFLLLMGIIEIGLFLFTYTVLEGVTTVGARIGRTGYSPIIDRSGYIRSEIMRYTGGFLDPDRLQVVMLSYDQLTNIGTLEPCITSLCGNGQPDIDWVDINRNRVRDDMGITGPGKRGAIAWYRTRYTWQFITPMIGSIFGNEEGKREIESSVAIQNEMFE